MDNNVSSSENNNAQRTKPTWREIWLAQDFKDSNGEKQSRWMRIGTAFKNRDGSDYLDFWITPSKGEGRINIRDPKSKEIQEEDENGRAQAA